MSTSSGIGTPYFYEYELGLIECLNMLYDEKIDYVTFQDPRFQSLDDVVVSRNGKLINIQIKHTSIDENMTFSFFWGENEKAKSLLNSLMNDWHKNCGKYDIEEIRIYSNKSYGINKTKNYVSFDHFVNSLLPSLKENYLFEGKTKLEKSTIQEFKRRLESVLGDKAFDFISLLSFHITPSLEDVLASVKKKIANIIGVTDERCIDNAFNSLQARLVYWTTELRNDAKVYKEDVYSALKDDSYDYIYSFSPQLPIYPSRISFADEIEKTIVNNDKFLFIQGKPGIGKTNFVSYLSTKKDTVIDFRFYTYYPAEKCNNIYSDDYGNYSGRDLWISLLLQLRHYFENNKLLYEYSFPLVLNYLSDIDLKKKTLEFLSIYKERNERCNILVDGLDHAARYNHDWNKTYLSEIPSLDELPKGVKFIFVGQPNYNYPSWIISESVTKLMPDLNSEDICIMLDEFNCDIIPKDKLALIIKNEVGTNTLNVFFAIKELHKLGNSFSVEEIIELLQNKRLNGSINQYYEWIYNSFSSDAILKQLIIIFGYTKLKINLDQFSLIFGLCKIDMMEKVNKLYPLICVDKNERCYAYHNDVRLFFKNKILYTKEFPILVNDLINNKINKLFNLKHDLLVDLVIAAKMNIFEFYNLEYLKECMINYIPFESMYDEIKKVAKYITNSTNVDELNIFNVYLTTINQMYNVKRYYYDYELAPGKQETTYCLSEIYQYELLSEYPTIIGDIYSCLLKCDFSRATYIFEKYIDKTTINGLLDSVLEDNNENDRYRLGYILRYTCSEIEKEYFEKLGYKFIEGWIKCSMNYPNEILINFSCMQKKYYSNLVDEYLDNVLSKDTENEYYEKIKTIIQSFDSDISMYVKLYEKYRQKDDLDYIKNNLPLLIPKHNTFNGQYSTFLKVMFLIADSDFDYNSYDKLHNKIREVLKIGVGNRAFPITEKLYNSSVFLHKVLNKGIRYNNKEILDIFDNVLFAPNQHGTGSAHDCDYYLSSKVIYKSIYEICSNNKTLKNDMINHVISINESVNKSIVWELIPLMLDEKDLCVKYMNRWISSNGYLWHLDNNDLYNVGTKIVEVLNEIGCNDAGLKLKSKLEYKKNIGFVNHKDYSLSILYDWMSKIQSDKYSDFIKKYACIILSINDYAYETGDNRYHSIIEKELIKMAIYSGPSYIDAVYSLKNTPKQFYNWRMNASEVIGGLESDLFENLKEIFDKWNLHIKNVEDNNLTIDMSQWQALIKKSWDDFVPCFEMWINDDNNYHKSDTLLKLYEYFTNEQRKLFANQFIRSHMINRSKYGYEYDGFDKVIEKYRDYISDEDFYLCIQNLLSLLDNCDYLYNIQNDYDLIVRCLILKGNHNDYISKFELIIEMYKLWIGYPEFIDIIDYKLDFDLCVTDYNSFVDKQLCK